MDKGRSAQRGLRWPGSNKLPSETKIRYASTHKSHVLHSGTVWDAVYDNPGHVLVVIGDNKMSGCRAS
jgi:hypothetical protein